MIQTTAEILEATKSVQNDHQFVGDLLLVFGARAQSDTLCGRNFSGPAKLLAHQNEWSLYSFPVASRWKGFPLLNFSFESWQVWVLGEIYGASDSKQIQMSVKDSIETKNIAGLNGHYLLLAWNSEKHEWNFWTNRLGTIHVYHADNEDRPAIGTCFGSVAATTAKHEFDEMGLLGFFTFGFFPQNRTHFKKVRILRPSTHEIFNSAGNPIRSERYWNWTFQPDRQRSYSDTVDEFGHLFHEIMKNLCSTGKIALPISGGLDSRSAVAALPEESDNAGNLWSYSYGYTPDSVELKIARQIAAARNIPFEAFSISEYMFDLLPYVIEAVEGFQDLTQTRQASVNEELQKHADYVIAAHWGDVWFDSFEVADQPTEEEMISLAFRKFRKRGSNWLINNLCTSFLKNDSADVILHEMIREELTPLSNIEEPEFRLKALKTEQWSFRWTLASLRSYQLAVFPRLPFYDTRMIEFFSTVPSSYVRKRRMQIDYLKRFAPDLARITWQPYDANLYNYRHFNSWLLPKRILKKAQRMISHRPAIQRNWEVQFLSDRGRKAVRQYLCSGPGSGIEQFVSVHKIDGLLNELFSSPSPENGYAVSMLLTFAAWLENHG